MAITYRVGVDVGGTFTDIVLLGSDGSIHTKKIASSMGNYAHAIVDDHSRLAYGELLADDPEYAALALDRLPLEAAPTISTCASAAAACARALVSSASACRTFAR